MLKQKYIKKMIIGIVFLLLCSSYAMNPTANPLPPKTVYGTSSRTDGESTFDAQVVGTASGYPNEYSNVWPGENMEHGNLM